MKKRGKVLIWVVAVAAVAALVWAIARPSEPSYQGKRLSVWLREFDHVDDARDVAGAREAVTMMSSNTLPFLVKQLGAHDPFLKRLLIDVLNKQSVIQWRPRMAEEEQYTAWQAFEVLGVTAAPAIPQVASLLTQADTADAAVCALAGIGPPALPALIGALTNRNAFGRAGIPSGLLHVAEDKHALVPVFLGCLSDADPALRATAAHALGWMRIEGATVVPALVPLMLDAAPRVRSHAAQAIGRFALLPELVVPALVRGIGDSDLMTRMNSVSGLAAFGQSAAAALPALEIAANGPDGVTSSRAKRAVLRIQCQIRDGAIVRGPQGNKTIALMFTGHEFAEGGETILDELKEHQARASFFFTGDFMVNTNFDRIIGRVINEDHLLGPHSDKHLLYCSWEKDRKLLVTREQFRADLNHNREKIRKAADRLDERVPPASTLPNPEFLEAFKRRYGFKPDTNAPETSAQQERPATASPDPELAEAFRRRYGVDLVAYPPARRFHSTTDFRYFLPPYEHYNRQIADWTAEAGMTLINYTPGTRSNADYTGEADQNYMSSQAIFDSIRKLEREDPNGLNGFILLLHIGAGPGRADKFHTRFGELLDVLSAKGYQFVRVDELLEAKETK